MKKDLTPLIMWLILTLGVWLLAYSRPGRTPGFWDGYSFNPDSLFAVFYVLWMLMEFRVSRRDVDTGGKKTSDSATCQVYGTGQALTILTALWFPSVWLAPNAAHAAGITLFVIGACYRSWAISSLGEFYSHRVRTVDQHRIVDSGPYRYTRHPAYAGMIIANAGICLFFFNRLTLCAFLFILLPAIVLRILVEEKTLFELEGYHEFAKSRKRLFPLVW